MELLVSSPQMAAGIAKIADTFVQNSGSKILLTATALPEGPAVIWHQGARPFVSTVDAHRAVSQGSAVCVGIDVVDFVGFFDGCVSGSDSVSGISGIHYISE